MTIKLYDGFFHHHDHFFCTARNEKHLHVHHDKCPIPGYELSFFPAAKKIITTRKVFICVNLADNYGVVFYSVNSKFSFLLRGPPENIVIRRNQPELFIKSA